MKLVKTRKPNSLLFLSAILLFLSCNNEVKSEGKQAKKMINQVVSGQMQKHKSKVCDIVTQKFLEKEFPTAVNFQRNAFDEPYPTCIYSFEVGDLHYSTTLTIAENIEAKINLKKSLGHYKNLEAIDNLGNEAFYAAKHGQVSVKKGNSIIHFSISKNRVGDKEKAVKIMKYILKKI